VLAGCQPPEMGCRSWVAANDVMIGCWCVVCARHCIGQEWKNSGLTVRGLSRELALLLGRVQGVAPMEGLRYPG